MATMLLKACLKQSVALMAWLLLANALWAQSLLVLADGNRLPVSILGINDELRIRYKRNDVEQEVPAADIVRWGEYRDSERGPQIILNDGSVIVGDVLEIGSKEITIGDATGLGRVLWSPSVLPRSAVRAMIFQPPVGELARDRLLDELTRSSPTTDELRLVGGEVIRGSLIAGGDERLGPNPPDPAQDALQIIVRGRTEPLAVSAAKVETIVLASERWPRTGGNEERPQVTLGFSDGTLAQCLGLRVGQSSVELRLAAGGTLKAALGAEAGEEGSVWSRVTLIQPHSPRVSYLSDLETIGYKHIPFTSIEWPYGRNQNALQGRLRSGKTIHLKGLGMHSASRLAYELDGSFSRLEAELAIDDAAVLAGSVVFKVILEESAGGWQAAYESPVIRGGDPLLPIVVELKQARRVALLVEYADRGDVLDYANWLNVRLVK